MFKDIKEEWIKALESGEYKQGTGCLRRTVLEDDKFCCLGVLCDLYQKKTGKGRWENSGFGIMFFQKERGQLPLEVAEWAGLDSTNPIVWDKNPDGTSYEWPISNHNDENRSFKDIARILSENKLL